MVNIKRVLFIAGIAAIVFLFGAKSMGAPVPSPLQLWGIQSFAGLGTDTTGVTFSAAQYLDFIATHWMQVLIGSLVALGIFAYWRTRVKRRSYVAFFRENREGIIYGIVALVGINLLLIYPELHPDNAWAMLIVKPFLASAVAVGALLGAIADEFVAENRWL